MNRDEAAKELAEAAWEAWRFDNHHVSGVTQHEFMTFVRILNFLSDWPEFRALLVACIEDRDRTDGPLA